MKPKILNKGDKIAIVSLSRGLLGMPFCKHELDLGIKRLKEMGLEPVIMPNAAKDMEYLEKHPEKRAEDLKAAFKDKEIKAIINAIGGEDTYKTIPYLMEDDEFKEIIKENPKIFMGFSDTTNNHLMLNKLGLSTFYGPCFLIDIAELDKEMLPYTKEAFNSLFENKSQLEIKPSPVWYKDRVNYSEEQLNIPREQVEETHNFETIKGTGIIEGKLYGGCIEILYDAMYGKSSEIYKKYDILPKIEEWKEKILFIETSDNKISPEELKKILIKMKEDKILENVKGILVGKPTDEIYYDEYKNIYKEVLKDIQTPILYNINFGHSVPRCILPYDAITEIDFDNKTITIKESYFK